MTTRAVRSCPATSILRNSTQWVVNLTLNGKAASAFGTLTTNLYNSYYAGAQSGNLNDEHLDQTAMVLDGDVQSAPVIAQPVTAGSVQVTGPAPSGFSRTAAQQFAALLGGGLLPVSLRIGATSVLTPAATSQGAPGE